MRNRLVAVSTNVGNLRVEYMCLGDVPISRATAGIRPCSPGHGYRHSAAGMIQAVKKKWIALVSSWSIVPSQRQMTARRVEYIMAARRCPGWPNFTDFIRDNGEFGTTGPGECCLRKNRETPDFILGMMIGIEWTKGNFVTITTVR